jgi:TetR/AcrR family acrAB operon transcriptional repressor
MARRTKADALATRAQLLDAARMLFAQQGVSHTSLQDIAVAAGTTRGAIYWHFKNKADLFNAMMELAILPIEQAMQHIGHDPAQDPLVELEQALIQTMLTIVQDPQVQTIFEIATLKVEYVAELDAVRSRHLQASLDAVAEMARSLQEAASRRALRLDAPPELAAQGLHALVAGLIHTWMLRPQGFDLVAVMRLSLRAYLSGLGLGPYTAQS